MPQNVNFFGGPDLSTEEVLGLELEAGERPEERLVFLSNVALDQWADTGERLETLFAGGGGEALSDKHDTVAIARPADMHQTPFQLGWCRHTNCTYAQQPLPAAPLLTHCTCRPVPSRSAQHT